MKRAVTTVAVLAVLSFTAPPLYGESPSPVSPESLEEATQVIATVEGAPSEKIAEALSELMSVVPGDEPAPLVLRNRSILTLRARFAGETPQERARQAASRFGKVISGKELPEASVKRFRSGSLLIVGKVPIVGITDLDLDPLGSESLDEVVAESLGRFEKVLGEIREERSLRALVRAVALTALATLVFLLLSWLAFRVRRAVLHRLEAGEKIVEKGVGKETVREARTLASLTRLGVTVATWAAVLFLFFAWSGFILRQFPFTRPWGEGIRGFVLTTVKTLLLGILSTLPDIFTVILIVFIARIMSRLVKAFFEGVESERIRPPMIFPETAMPTRRLLTAVIWLFALVAMYPYLPGSESEAFKGLGVILGLMVSLGASGVIGQAMSGLVLMYSRALRAGDYVRIAETEGVVLSLGMLATKIRTIQREEVTIPNAVVLGTSTKNFSRLAGREGVILSTTVTIGYSEPWRRVHAALIEAAGKTPGLKKEPKPFVRQTALSDFYVEYKLNAYLESPEKRLPTLAALHANIQDTFNAAGIVIVSPHYVNDPPHPAPEEGGEE